MNDFQRTLPQRNCIRLPAECYRRGDPFFLTICTQGRAPVIIGEVRELIAGFLRRQSADNAGAAFGWVLMPDHVHVLLHGASDAVQWVRGFKSAVTSTLRRKNVTGFAWQRSFHDRGIRKNDRLDDVALYLLENPVRAGLCAWFDQWPWSYVAGVKKAG